MSPSLQPNGNGRAGPTFAGDRENRLSGEAGPRQLAGRVDPQEPSSQIFSDLGDLPPALRPFRGIARRPERQPSSSLARPAVSAQSVVRPPSGIVDGFAKICDRWQLGEHDTAMLIGFTDNVSLVRSILNGDILPFTRDMRDRMTHIIGISFGLGEIFDDDFDSELEWLRRKRDDLQGEAPLAYMLEGSMQNLLRVADLVLRARGF